MNWFKESSWLLPNWAWLSIAAAVVVVIAAIAIVAAVRAKRKGKDAQGASENGKAESNGEDAERQEASEEHSDERSKENELATEKSDGAQPKQDKEADASVSAKEKTEKEESKKVGKVYHISKRKEDGKWQVKAAGGSKAIKLFRTQAEAIDYAKSLAENQEARIVIHKADGSFRNLTYRK